MSSSRCAPVLLIVAWSVAAGPAKTAAVLQAPTPPTAQDRPAALAEEAGLRLFGIDDPTEVIQYFQDHRVAVTVVDESLPDRAGEWSVSLVYPSLNFGGAGEGFGSTVMYSHDAIVTIPEEIQEVVNGIDTRRQLLVLEVIDGTDVGYELVGTAARRPRDDGVMNWFSGKPELVFRFSRF